MTYDTAGRTRSWNGWWLTYEGEVTESLGGVRFSLDLPRILDAFDYWYGDYPPFEVMRDSVARLISWGLVTPGVSRTGALVLKPTRTASDIRRQADRASRSTDLQGALARAAQKYGERSDSDDVATYSLLTRTNYEAAIRQLKRGGPGSVVTRAAERVTSLIAKFLSRREPR